MKTENIFSIILIALALFGFTWSAYRFYGPYEGTASRIQNTAQNYQKALRAELPDKCATPPEGYTDESWREHMSHHPDRYEECL